MDYSEQIKEIKDDILDMEAGIKRGWTYGFKDIDSRVGRMRKGQLIMLGGYSGCFAKGTPVLTSVGYVGIERLKEGDLVATYDGGIDYNPIEFVKCTINQPKPMIQFNYDGETIRATYDHPFFNGKKYYPLYYLIWGKMAPSQRAQLKLFCEQYGQNLDHKAIWPLTHSDTQTWEGQGWASENCSEWEDSKSTQDCGSGMGSKSIEFAIYQSQRLQSSQQCGHKSRVVYSKTKQSTRFQEWQIKRVTQKGANGNNEIFFGTNKRDKRLLAGSCSRDFQDPYSQKERTIKSIREPISTNSKVYTASYTQRAGVISQIQIKEAEPYYGIGVKNVHTYIVGYSQLPVHNTGKSAFILNMADKIVKEWKETDDDRFEGPRIAIFSTELTRKAYIYRHLLLRMGIYQLQLEQNPKIYSDRFYEEADKWQEEAVLNPDVLRIFGNISHYEDIVAQLSFLKEAGEKLPNIVFIDYVQELSANKMYDAKDTMPYLAKGLKGMAIEYNCVVVAVSQINNYGMESGNNPVKTQLMPFTFGKEMANASHTALLLRREKENGELTKTLQVHVVKAREGMTGQIELAILDGYNLCEIS
jgi:replicative DNA helicase